jgi:hypothetical protein
MPGKKTDPQSGLLNRTKVQHDSIVVTQRGWRARDVLERGALDILLAAGPQTRACDPEARNLPVYVGFPWSAYFDSLKDPKVMEAPLLRSALLVLRTKLPRGATAVTVCSHPDLPDNLAQMAAAGVTDVFWTGTMPGVSALPQAPGVRLHPFPALPDLDQPAPAGEGPAAAFALCPEGGNRPQLWAAIAAGLIPVLSLDGPLLPGPEALWQAAAVLHDGSEAAKAALPAQLEALAADPSRLDAMRNALAGLHLIFGPGRLVHDVLLCLTEQTDPALGTAPQQTSGDSLLRSLIQRFAGRETLTRGEAHLVLQQAANDLLASASHDLALAPGPASTAAWRLVSQARSTLADDHGALNRFDEVLAVLRARDILPTRIGSSGSASRNTAPLRVFLLGPRGQRTPLAYAALRRHLAGRITLVDKIETADLVVTGWSRDLEDNRAQLAALWRKGIRPRLVVLSEEPLWDSLWSGDLAPRDRVLDCDAGLQLAYRSLNHVNSAIFRFQALPWFILSDDRFAARYALLMAPFAALSPQALLQHWRAAPLQVAFVAERREGDEFAPVFPLEGVAGLSRYRSRVAELTPGAAVLRIGQGWPGTETRRQALPDWHLDKLAQLHGRVRLCGAYENTLHSSYITEKPFDAFAVGAIPVTLADIGDQLFDLIQPEAMLNTRFSAPDVAAARIAAFVPDMIVAEAWRETAQNLLARLRDPALILAERQRLADACFDELTRFARQPEPASAP